MAASENDAAQSTKIIGSTSDELNNGTQSPNYELEETARMERILKDTQALAQQKNIKISLEFFLWKLRGKAQFPMISDA